MHTLLKKIAIVIDPIIQIGNLIFAPRDIESSFVVLLSSTQIRLSWKISDDIYFRKFLLFSALGHTFTSTEMCHLATKGTQPCC